MLAPLTRREARVVDYLEQQMRGLVVPSFAEMARAAGFSSKGYGITRLLENLEDKGYLTRERGKRRSVRLLYSTDGHPFNAGSVRVPVVGCIAAGEPLPVPSADYRPFIGDMVELTREMLGGSDDVYALRVQGDSMVDALVRDGDIVIMQHRRAVDDGQMAAVWIKGKEETTLKYFHHEGDRVRLQPAHPTMTPLYYHPSEVEVQGKVLMVVRSVN
jgi:repressor LexA